MNNSTKRSRYKPIICYILLFLCHVCEVLSVKFININKNDVIFDENVMFRISTKTKLECCTLCSQNACKMFTFIKGEPNLNCLVYNAEYFVGANEISIQGAISYVFVGKSKSLFFYLFSLFFLI